MDEIFDIWPTTAEMASDLGVKYQTAAAWKRRGIPADRFGDVIEAARGRGRVVTYQRLHELSRATKRGAA